MSHEGDTGELDNESHDLRLAPFSNTRSSTDSGSSRAKPSVQWKPASRTVDETLAEGLSNEDLWLLIRRFNKVSLRKGRSPWPAAELTCDCF